MLVNLISNAIKHTPPHTTITLGADTNGTVARIFVHDTGPGIPIDIQRRLFERFAATGNSSGAQTNTGLGLTFCKLAAEAQGGSISVASTPGQGTTFTIVLPIQSSDTPSLTSEHAASAAL
jgi:signal transduction histidine kinase